MGRELLVDLLLLAGLLLLAVRLRRENRVSATTILFLPAVMLAFMLTRRVLVSGLTGALDVFAAGLAGAFAGLVVATHSYVRVEPERGFIVVRATLGSLMIWPGCAAVYVLGRRMPAMMDNDALGERLDGIFFMFFAALVIAERGWLYHAYRDAATQERRAK